MDAIPFPLAYFRPEVFARWLQELLQGGSAHGSYLVQLLGTPGICGYECGMVDNTAGADTILAAARRAGWITEGEVHPSLEQLVFGVGGLHGLPSRKACAGTYPCEHVWHPGANLEGLREFVREMNGGAP